MKIKLKLQYKGAKTIMLPLESDWFDEQDVEPILTDIERTGRVTDIIIMDEMGREWNKKEFAKLKLKMESEPTNPCIYFDGGFARESLVAGIGMIIYYQKGNEYYRLRSNARLDELTNNNEAEYVALYNAVGLLEEIGVAHLPVLVRGDSQGVIKQLMGEWPCFDPVLNKWLDRIEGKIKQLGLKAEFEIISRKHNREADQLATQALSNNLIHSHLKIEKSNWKGRLNETNKNNERD